MSKRGIYRGPYTLRIYVRSGDRALNYIFFPNFFQRHKSRYTAGVLAGYLFLVSTATVSIDGHRIDCLRAHCSTLLILKMDFETSLRPVSVLLITLAVIKPNDALHLLMKVLEIRRRTCSANLFLQFEKSPRPPETPHCLDARTRTRTLSRRSY